MQFKFNNNKVQHVDVNTIGDSQAPTINATIDDDLMPASLPQLKSKMCKYENY